MSAPSREPPAETTARHANPSTARELAAVALGGTLGASLRHALTLAAQGLGLQTALGTLAANLSGAFLLGTLLARFDAPAAHPLLRPFWVIGVFGSFTTFSTLALESRLLADARSETFGVLHLAGSIALGLGAFALGHRMRRPRR